jgi:hypothetical protein
MYVLNWAGDLEIPGHIRSLGRSCSQVTRASQPGFTNEPSTAAGNALPLGAEDEGYSILSLAQGAL